MSGRTGCDWRSIAWRGLAVAGLVAALATGWLRLAGPRRDLPAPHFSDVRPPISTDRCAACHAGQALSLQEAPHTVTLRSASAEDVLHQFHGLDYRDPKSADVTDRFVARDQSLWLQTALLPAAVPIHWIFGSGRHARTPVTVLNTNEGAPEIIEHRLSWYPEFGIDLTLGTDNAIPQPGWHGLGKRLNIDDAADCFGCHSSWLPTTQGKLDLSRIQTGVQCSRCHQEGEVHMEAANAGQAVLSSLRWSELSPLDSVRRCGECHRRDDQMTPFELRTTNPLIVRFAPAGISQSRCFTQQDQLAPTESGAKLRLDCMTCHDPHRPAETREQFYVDRCVTCHTGQTGSASNCSAVSTSQHCLNCHMPKVEVQPHLSFTDHWIRRQPEHRATATQKSRK